MSPPHDFALAERVTVSRSGGLKPVDQKLVFAMDRPAPKGFTKSDVMAVLRAAASPELKDVAPPTNTCCDRYMYRIAITYPDGTSTSFTTVEGAPMDHAVSHLISLAS